MPMSLFWGKTKDVFKISSAENFTTYADRYGELIGRDKPIKLELSVGTLYAYTLEGFPVNRTQLVLILVNSFSSIWSICTLW